MVKKFTVIVSGREIVSAYRVYHGIAANNEADAIAKVKTGDYEPSTFGTEESIDFTPYADNDGGYRATED